MLLSASTTLVIIGSLIFVRADISQQRAYVQGVATQAPMQSYLPALVDPRSSACQIQHVNDKQIIPAFNNLDECLQDKKKKAMIEQNKAITAAYNAVKMAQATPSAAPKCIKSVDTREMACVKKKLLDNLKSKPQYAVAADDNAVDVFKNGKRIATTFASQKHFEKVLSEKPDKNKLAEKAQMVIFNALGEVLASKENKRKPHIDCVCPGQELPGTTETTKVASPCIIENCKNYDLFINILGQSSISNAKHPDRNNTKDENNNVDSNNNKNANTNNNETPSK